MRKILIIFTLLIVTFNFFACADNNNAWKNPFDEPQYEWGTISGQTINIWGDRDSIERVYFKRAYELYEKLTGNTVRVRGLSKEEIDKDIPNAYRSDDAEIPDVLLWQGGTNLTPLDPDRNFCDMTDAVWVDDLMDSSINQTIYNSKIVGLPYGESSVSGTLYNKKIFNRLNIKVPTTQSEFLDACQKLLDNGITPLYLPYADITMLLYQFPMDVFLQDRNILDGLNDGVLSYSDIPEMRTIVQWYKTMGDKGFFGTDYKDNNWDGMSPALESDKYAMMLCWDTWLYTDYKGKNQEDFGLMPAFIGMPNSGTFEGPNIILSLVSKRGNNTAAALELINFMSDPYIYNQAFRNIYTAPVFKNQLGSMCTPQYAESERLIEQLFHDSTAWLRVKGFSQIDARHIQQYMSGECSLDECLSRMNEARLQRILDAEMPGAREG